MTYNFPSTNLNSTTLASYFAKALTNADSWGKGYFNLTSYSGSTAIGTHHTISTIFPGHVYVEDITVNTFDGSSVGAVLYSKAQEGLYDFGGDKNNIESLVSYVSQNFVQSTSDVVNSG